ncbi:MAG: aldo/keto reductase [Armatimonadota bacterium]|nr:aldo/keto reductase [Armatimonadota bacterium]
MSDKLTWGIIGAGAIARTFAGALATSKTGKLLAVGSRTQEAADVFGERFSVPRRYSSYDALLADTDVQAVYISTPHPMHAEWAIKAAEAGKHILCEKPLALNYPEAMAVVESACRNDVFLMEAFMYRCHPQTAKLVELIRDGAIGEVRVIQATFSFHGGSNFEGRLLNNQLGGGGIMDVGCYCVSMSRLIAGVATGKPFAEPIDLKAVGKVGDKSRVDEYALAVLKFPGDIVAELSTGVQVSQENVVRIFGSEGNIFVPVPWTCARDGGVSKIILHKNGRPQPEEITIETDLGLFAIEADTVAANIENRQAPSPCMTWEDTLGNMKTLDRWRGAIGMSYDIELPEADFPTVDRHPLTVRIANNTKYGLVEGIDKPISRLVLGAALEGMQIPLPHASVLFDEFFASGGNCFDTAYVYAGGMSERVLGQWIRNRGVREQVVVLDKGAHSPRCNPSDMTAQLLESLERLQTNYVDLYMLHRDNPDIPVDDFIDALNRCKNEGYIRSFGASNWTIERIQAANDYAKSKGLAGFTAVSNQFSLARMVAPVWGGCYSASDSKSREWFNKTRMPLMAWSSTARGFFVSGNPNDLLNAEMVRCWYSEDNFKRLDRAKELAGQLGVAPITVALAYALCQPSPMFALIGPQSIDELRISLKGLDVELRAGQLRYLNLED